jgi:hypothetical protein
VPSVAPAVSSSDYDTYTGAPASWSAAVGIQTRIPWRVGWKDGKDPDLQWEAGEASPKTL